MEVHCHLPIRVRLLGTPGEDDLARLSAAVASAVAARLETARRLVTQRHGVDLGAGPVGERYDPDRGTGAEYAVASYDDRGRPVGVPLARPAPAWTLLRALNFRTTVGDFFDWVERGLPQPLPERALYTDLDADVRWVSVWWVQTNRTLTLGELAGMLAARAIQLARLGPAQTIVHAVTPFDRGRLELADLDGSGQVRALPSLDARNARRVEGTGGDAVLLHGSRVVFAAMVLPRIEVGDLLVLGPRIDVVVPLSDLGFLVDAAEFESATGVAWARFAEEFGADPVTVTLQPATVRQAASTSVLSYLLSRAAAQPTPTTATATTTTTATGLPASRFWVLNQAALRSLPPPIQTPATAWTDPATLTLDGGSVLARLSPGARVLFATAVLPIDRDRVVAAQLLPTARKLAAQLLTRLTGDPDDREWRWGLYGFLGSEFGAAPSVRPPGGTLFEHVLAVLEAGGHLVELFDRVDASRFFVLRHRLLQHSLPTRYAEHPRVRRLLSELSERSVASLRSSFFPDAQPAEIWLDGDPGRRVRVGEVIGDRDSLYLTEKDLKELKPERARQLRAACEQIRVDLHQQVGRGEDGTEYSDEAFATEVLTRAVRSVKITDKDFTEVTLQRSMKIVAVTHREIASLPSFEVAFRFVERRKGGSWVVVSDEIRESADDFQARLIYWALGRAGEVYQVIGLSISVVGLVAVAWSAGIVAALISLAGGGLAVGVSIGIAEVIYIFRVVFGDATWSVRGFLLAALEGYLMALGFRAGAGLGRAAADRLGTATLRRFLAGWVAQKLITGVVGGALSAGLSTFANDVVNIATGRGSWSSVREYVFHLGIGAAVGIVAEFALAPALNAALAKGGSALGSAADLARQIRAEGWSSVQLSATLTEGLANLRAALTEVAGEVTAKGFTSAFAERVGQVLEQMAGGAVARRVLELAGARFTRQATEGLQRFLRAAEAGNPAGALKIANVFAAHPAETVHFLEVLAQLDDAVARRLIDGTFGSRADLAAFLGRLARYTPEQQRASIRMLAKLDLEVGSAVPGKTTEQLLQAQLNLSLRLQSAGARLEVAEIEREIARLRQRLARTDAGNARRLTGLRNALADQERLLAAATDRADRAATVAVGRPSDVVPTDPELDAALTALEAGTAGPGAGASNWIRLPARAINDAPGAVERLVRPIFRSTSGNRVVFRVEGGVDTASRSRDLVQIDAAGNVRLATGDRALNVNFGVFERAIEFLVKNRAGARLKVFEIEEAWFRSVRGVSTPEQGKAARLVELDPGTGAVIGPGPRGGGITEVEGLPRTVDTRAGEDQLQIPAKLVPELQEFIVSGSGRVVEFR